jgi:RHS repeat-associated protein
MQRIYRSGSGNPGPFGIGTGHQYSYQLGLAAFLQQGSGVITLVTPDGNQFPMNQQPDGTFTNSTVPSLAGAVLTATSFYTYSLRWKNGTVYQFQRVYTSYLTSITDPNGNTVTLTLNPSQPLQITQITDAVGRSLNLSYDSFNRITSITDPIGRTVQYSYNGQGTLATVTDPGGGITSYAYDSNNNLTAVTDARGVGVARNTYDANGRVVKQTLADGGVFAASYTPLGFVTPASPTDYPASPATSPVLNTIVTDPLGSQSSHRFSPIGLFINITDAEGQTRTVARDSSHNNIVNSISGNGSCTVCPPASAGAQTFTLDANGNFLSQTDSLGNTSAFTYNPSFNEVTSAQDPLGNITRLTFDASGNLLSSTDADGHPTSYVYNSFGQVTQATDGLGQTTNFSYDSLGNLVSVTDPLGNTTTMTYDAVSRLIQTTDALGRTTKTTYDPLDRVISRIDAKGNTTAFTYDAVGNLLSLTDGKGNTTSFTYDGLNRLLARTDPLGKTDTRTYDKNGNLIQFVDRRGQTGTFTYDALNRLTNESYSDGSTVARSYDANGRLIAVNDSAGGVFDFSYDAAGRLLNSATQFGTVQFSYDAASRVISRKVRGQSPLTYGYDPVGNLLSATLSQASATFGYDADNRLQDITRGNGVSSSYVYDNAGDLLTLTHSGGQAINIPLTFSYDSVGSRTSQSTSVGQPLTTQPATNTFDNANRLLSSGPTPYSYDANGNLTSSSGPTGTTTFTWDARNRLVSIAGPGQTTTFMYDFAGNLISENQSGSVNLTQNFVLDDLTNVAYVSRSNGDSLSILAGRSIDQHVAAVHSGGQVEFGLADAIGSTVATADQTGKQLGAFFYEPFGQTTSASSYPFQFTGRVPVSGSLYNFRARDYSTTDGRFISEDPLGFRAGDANLFRYVGNNPTNQTDPTGLQDAWPSPIGSPIYGNPMNGNPINEGPGNVTPTNWPPIDGGLTMPISGGPIMASPFSYNRGGSGMGCPRWGGGGLGTGGTDQGGYCVLKSQYRVRRQLRCKYLCFRKDGSTYEKVGSASWIDQGRLKCDYFIILK